MPAGFDEIQTIEQNNAKVIFLSIKEKLTRDDYALFVPQLEWQMGGAESVRLLVHLIDFKGWTIGAIWEDTKFAAKHFKSIDKLAIVGDRQWEKNLSVFSKPFTAADVRYFDTGDMAAAREWINVP